MIHTKYFLTLVIGFTLLTQAHTEPNQHSFGFKAGIAAKFYPYYQYWGKEYGFHVGHFQILYASNEKKLWHTENNFIMSGIGLQKILFTSSNSSYFTRRYLFAELNALYSNEESFVATNKARPLLSSDAELNPNLNLGYGWQLHKNHWGVALECGYAYQQTWLKSPNWIQDEYLFTPTLSTMIFYAFNPRQSILGNKP